MIDEIDELAVDNYICPYCRAGYGQWCKTKSGKRATWLHSSRQWPLQQAWGAGYQECEKYAREDRQRRADLLRTHMRQHGVDEQAIDEILEAVMARRYVA